MRQRSVSAVWHRVRRSVAHAVRRGIWVLGLVTLSGCVTETTGGLPKPLPDDERLQAQLDLARGYLAARDWGGARRPLERALEIDPRSTEAHTLMAMLFQQEREPFLAEQSFKRALQIDADSAMTLNNFGTFLYRQERFDEAETVLERVSRNTGYARRSQVFENLGLVRLRMADADGAKDAFERAIELNTSQARSHLEMADLQLKQGKLRTAQTHFDYWRRLARPTSRSLCIGMRLASAQRDTDAVASFALALSNLYPDSAEAESCQANST